MTGYSATIKSSSQELTKKERIQLADTSNAVQLDKACEGASIVINPDLWAILQIHNEKSDNKDYEVYIIVDEGGVKYTTSSEAFWTTFINIYNEMKDETEEDWAIEVYHKDSKNYVGKQFITCSVV